MDGLVAQHMDVLTDDHKRTDRWSGGVGGARRGCEVTGSF